MSRLSEMIKELCPDGVEYRKLEEIAHYVRERIKVSEIDVCNYVGVEHLRQNTEGREMSVTLPEVDFVISFHPEDILIGNIRPYLKKAWLADCNGGTNGDVLAIRIVDKMYVWPQYLFYILSSEQFFMYDMKYAKGAKMPRGDKKAVMNYAIPIPPLAIQNEIVKLLDNFTELTAELQLRKKQYSFYRDSLLNFSLDDAEVEWKTLGETTKSISSGKNKIRVVDGEYPVYGSTGIIGYCTNFVYEHAQILVARVGAVGYVQIADGRYDVSDNTLIVDVLSTINMKYIFYYLGYMNLSRLAHGAGQPLITAGQLKKLIIPIPPLETQAKIVSILDQFDELCNDLTQGPPAEIAARKKQYEYYRDKLLTFPRKGKSGGSAR